jgi:three-Cys-motif partner protein
MAIPREAIWELEPHTAAKHTIIREYLKAWYPICAHGKFAAFTYAEGFAGPGIYKGGEPGSPVIALDVFLQRGLLQTNQQLNILLIEKDRSRYERLKAELADKAAEHGGLPPELVLDVKNDDCESALLPALQKVAPHREPFFAVLDGWGGPDAIPFDLARGAASWPGGEVLVTFQPQHLIRFAKVDERAQAGDRSFGSADWRAVVNEAKEDKKAFLVNAYRKSLISAGFAHVASFEMIDEKNNKLHLVFATNHILGLEKMKDAMWKVDRRQGFRFRDPRDRMQTELFFEETADLAPLRRAILGKLAEQQEISVSELRDFALEETVYRRKDATTVLRQMYRERRIVTTSGRAPTTSDMVRLGSTEEPAQDALF